MTGTGASPATRTGTNIAAPRSTPLTLLRVRERAAPIAEGPGRNAMASSETRPRFAALTPLRDQPRHARWHPFRDHRQSSGTENRRPSARTQDVVGRTLTFLRRVQAPPSPTHAVPAAQSRRRHLPLGALVVQLNDAHHWTRERIAAWVADSDVPQDESHPDKRDSLKYRMWGPKAVALNRDLTLNTPVPV
jgi:hypothetical protein